MKVMVLVKASPDSEAGVMPSQELLLAMAKFNEELVQAGIMLAAEGLKPSSQGARVRFSGKNRTVVDGPFSQTKELVAGFWLWQVPSLEEAVAWVKRCPNPMRDDSEIEIRPVFSVEDFGDAATPEIRERESRLRKMAEIGATQHAAADRPAAAGGAIAPARFESRGERLIAGINATYTPQSCGDIAKQWEDFVANIGKVPGQIGGAAYGVLWNQKPSREFDYLCGVEVAEGSKLPAGFSHVRLPEARYAVFDHGGHVSTIAHTIESIQSEWLPASEFEPAAPIVFERYTEKFNQETHCGGIEIWIPVRKKASKSAGR